VFLGAENTAIVEIVDAGRTITPLEGAHLLVARHIALPVAAVGTNVLLNQVLTRPLVHVDAFAVKPVLAAVASDHEAVIVRATAETIRPTVGFTRSVTRYAIVSASAVVGSSVGSGGRC